MRETCWRFWMCCLRPQRKGKTGDEADSSRMTRSWQGSSWTSREQLDSHQGGMTVSRDSRGKAGHKVSSLYYQMLQGGGLWEDGVWVSQGWGVPGGEGDPVRAGGGHQVQDWDQERVQDQEGSGEGASLTYWALETKAWVLLLLSSYYRPAMWPARRFQPRSVFHRRSKSICFNKLFRVMLI